MTHQFSSGSAGKSGERRRSDTWWSNNDASLSAAFPSLFSALQLLQSLVFFRTFHLLAAICHRIRLSSKSM